MKKEIRKDKMKNRRRQCPSLSQFAPLFFFAHPLPSCLHSLERTHHGLLHARRLRLGDDGDVLLLAAPRRRRTLSRRHPRRRRRRFGRRRDEDIRGHLQPRQGPPFVCFSLSFNSPLFSEGTDAVCVEKRRSSGTGECGAIEEREGDKCCRRAPSPFF